MSPMECNDSVLLHDDQQAELQTVLSSAMFARAPRLARLLEYLCRHYLSGQTEPIKEFKIATDVLGRDADFDQTRDAIVRVEIHRLRKRLREYYESEGAEHALEIQIGVGQYSPIFVPRS